LFAKNKTKLILNKMIVDTEKDYKYKFKDEYFEKRGKYYLRDLISFYKNNCDYHMLQATCFKRIDPMRESMY
jgi:hypothetical protein